MYKRQAWEEQVVTSARGQRGGTTGACKGLWQLWVISFSRARLIHSHIEHTGPLFSSNYTANDGWDCRLAWLLSLLLSVSQPQRRYPSLYLTLTSPTKSPHPHVHSHPSPTLIPSPTPTLAPVWPFLCSYDSPTIVMLVTTPV